MFVPKAKFISPETIVAGKPGSTQAVRTARISGTGRAQAQLRLKEAAAKQRIKQTPSIFIQPGPTGTGKSLARSKAETAEIFAKAGIPIPTTKPPRSSERDIRVHVVRDASGEPRVVGAFKRNTSAKEQPLYAHKDFGHASQPFREAAEKAAKELGIKPEHVTLANVGGRWQAVGTVAPPVPKAKLSPAERRAAEMRELERTARARVVDSAGNVKPMAEAGKPAVDLGKLRHELLHGPSDAYAGVDLLGSPAKFSSLADARRAVADLGYPLVLKKPESSAFRRSFDPVGDLKAIVGRDTVLQFDQPARTRPVAMNGYMPNAKTSVGVRQPKRALRRDLRKQGFSPGRAKEILTENRRHRGTPVAQQTPDFWAARRAERHAMFAHLFEPIDSGYRGTKGAKAAWEPHLDWKRLADYAVHGTRPGGSS